MKEKKLLRIVCMKLYEREKKKNVQFSLRYTVKHVSRRSFGFLEYLGITFKFDFLSTMIEHACFLLATKSHCQNNTDTHS